MVDQRLIELFACGQTPSYDHERSYSDDQPGDGEDDEQFLEALTKDAAAFLKKFGGILTVSATADELAKEAFKQECEDCQKNEQKWLEMGLEE